MTNWYALTATGRPMIAHKLDPGEEVMAEQDRNAVSLCGTTRGRTWKPLDYFVSPESFRKCGICSPKRDG